jgi:hypothetical protein
MSPRPSSLVPSPFPSPHFGSALGLGISSHIKFLASSPSLICSSLSFFRSSSTPLNVLCTTPPSPPRWSGEEDGEERLLPVNSKPGSSEREKYSSTVLSSFWYVIGTAGGWKREEELTGGGDRGLGEKQ